MDSQPERVEKLARTILHDPIRIQIGQHNAATLDIQQELMFVGREDGKLVAMRQLVQVWIDVCVVAFA